MFHKFSTDWSLQLSQPDNVCLLGLRDIVERLRSCDGSTGQPGDGAVHGPDSRTLEIRHKGHQGPVDHSFVMKKIGILRHQHMGIEDIEVAITENYDDWLMIGSRLVDD